MKKPMRKLNMNVMLGLLAMQGKEGFKATTPEKALKKIRNP